MSINRYRKFKRKHKIVHILIVAFAVVMFWWGAWGILDDYFLPENDFFSYILAILIALVVLYLDDFHLKELE